MLCFASDVVKFPTSSKYELNTLQPLEEIFSIQLVIGDLSEEPSLKGYAVTDEAKGLVMTSDETFSFSSLIFVHKKKKRDFEQRKRNQL